MHYRDITCSALQEMTTEHPPYILLVSFSVCKDRDNAKTLRLAVYNYLTHSMEWSHSHQVNSGSAGKEISRLYRIRTLLLLYKSSPLDAILSKMNTVHIPADHFLNTHVHVILPSTSRSSKRCLQSSRLKFCMHFVVKKITSPKTCASFRNISQGYMVTPFRPSTITYLTYLQLRFKYGGLLFHQYNRETKFWTQQHYFPVICP
jgi:hypothetical protein